MQTSPAPNAPSRPAKPAVARRTLANSPETGPDDLKAPDDDATLVARCQRGDGAAWAVLVKRYQRLVYTIALRIGHDEHGADDIFQTVFARLVKHLPHLGDPSRLQAWIVTTTKREALLQRKLSQRNVSMTRADDAADEAPEWDVADESPNAEEALAELQQLHLLRLAMDRLDPRCRNLLLLLFRDEDEKLSYDEVARRLGIAVGSIGPTRSRCLDKLRILAS